MSTLPELRNNWPAENDAVERAPVGQAAGAEAGAAGLTLALTTASDVLWGRKIAADSTSASKEFATGLTATTHFSYAE